MVKGIDEKEMCLCLFRRVKSIKMRLGVEF